MIEKYSLRKNGSKYITNHFQVREFRCLDGTNTIYIDRNLVIALENVRSKYKRPIVFNSAYRTVRHNRRVGGVKDSCHIFGKAVDIPYNKDLYTLLKKSGLYVLNEGSWLHCDSRYIQPHTGRRPLLRKGSKGEWVVYLQHMLTKKGFKCIKDGAFGKTTKSRVQQFQKRYGLLPDGLVGSKTWNTLQK